MSLNFDPWVSFDRWPLNLI